MLPRLGGYRIDELDEPYLGIWPSVEGNSPLYTFSLPMLQEVLFCRLHRRVSLLKLVSKTPTLAPIAARLSIVELKISGRPESDVGRSP